MPWTIVSKDGKHCVHKKNADGSAGEQLHCYDNEKEAQDYLKALYSHTHDNKSVFQNVRFEMLESKRYIVAPGVIVREKVLNNYLLPADEIGKFYLAWNGSPITIRHPKQNNGSANAPQPDVPIVGRFYNAQFDGKRLTGEYWLDESLLLSVSPITHKNIISGLPVETSTGYYSDEEEAHGVFENLEYELIHKNLRPDHIAILPDEIGACSVRDGCGVNRNSQTCNNCDKCKLKMKGNKSMTLEQLLAKLTPKGWKIKTNEANGNTEYEVEEPTASPPAPVTEPVLAPAASLSLTQADITALKALAASAPVIQNAAQALMAQTTTTKADLVAQIKANSANFLGDNELNAMDVPALEKLNAHLNTNFFAAAGLFQNVDANRIAEAPDTFAWPVLEGGK